MLVAIMQKVKVRIHISIPVRDWSHARTMKLKLKHGLPKCT